MSLVTGTSRPGPPGPRAVCLEIAPASSHLDTLICAVLRYYYDSGVLDPSSVEFSTKISARETTPPSPGTLIDRISDPDPASTSAVDTRSMRPLGRPLGRPGDVAPGRSVHKVIYTNRKKEKGQHWHARVRYLDNSALALIIPLQSRGID
jgi:hypothetical protein